MKINISSIENQNLLSEVKPVAANEVVGGRTLVEVNYTGIVEGFNPWQKLDLNSNSSESSINFETGDSIGSTAVTFSWAGGTGSL